LTGRKLSEETKKKISEKQKGRKHAPQEGFRKGCIPHLSTHANRFKPGLVPYNKGVKRPDISGEKHPNWQGGKTSEAMKIKNSLEYKQWRTAVFTRDGFKCVACGDARGGNLEADHIKPQSRFPELRFDVANGRTLCKPCHQQTETYGFWRKNPSSQTAA